MQRVVSSRTHSFFSTSAVLALTVLSVPSLPAASAYLSPSAQSARLRPSPVFSSRLFSNSPTMSSSSTLTVAQFPCLNDNYGFLIHDEATGQTAAIDTPEAGPYKDEMTKRGWTLTHIFNTHHHHDHTGGNLELKQAGVGASKVTVVGPAVEKPRIPGITFAVQGGDKFEFGNQQVQVLDVGGHTKGHVAFYFPSQGRAFVGDSLFALGCGRMFEGTASPFWASLERLRALPDETVVYCAHEYTAANAQFAMSVEPGNPNLVARVQEISAKRSKQEPTVPTTIGEEKETNPFLRCDTSDEIRRNVGVASGDSDADAFGKVRKAKDTFRG